MLYYLIKLLLSAGIIVVVSEVAKANATLGALIKSLPLISILAIIWLYVDTRDVGKIAELSVSTFWLVLPTLPMFLVLPALLKNGLGFYPSLGISIGVLLVCYLIAVPMLARLASSSDLRGLQQISVSMICGRRFLHVPRPEAGCDSNAPFPRQRRRCPRILRWCIRSRPWSLGSILEYAAYSAQRVRNQWGPECRWKLSFWHAGGCNWLRGPLVFYRLHAHMKNWRKTLAVFVLLVLPLQALAASLSVLACHSGTTHEATVETHGHDAGASHASDARGEHEIPHQHEDDRGADRSGFFKCHHIFSGMPAAVVVNVPAELPEFESAFSLLYTLFVPELPQRPPRT